MLVALSSEESSFFADRSDQHAAEAWTDETLRRFEPRAAVLARSPALAWRLLAARVLRGERPDMVIVPLPLLHRGSVLDDVLEHGRELEPLVRSYTLTGEPSEYALSKLADERPLHVEMDRTWSRRLLSHLAPDGLWLEYLAEPQGQSDRKLAWKLSLPSLDRVLAETTRTPVGDVATALVVTTTAREHAAVLGQLGEREGAHALLDRIASLRTTGAMLPQGSLRFAITGVARAVALVTYQGEPQAQR
jgi:hypothetical protein